MNVFSTTWKRGKIHNIDELQNLKESELVYILDTNIVIYIRGYYEDKEKFKNDNKKIYKEFIDTINFLRKTNSKIIYQFACDECSKDKSTNVTNIVKYKYMVNSINHVLNKNFDDEYPIDINDLEKLDNSKINNLKSSSTTKEIKVITYPLLLKLNVFSPIYLIFAIYYFGNYSTVLKNISIKKEQDFITNKILGAAIDLTLPTICSQLAESYSYDIIPIFITFDKGIKAIFDALYIKDLMEINEEFLPEYQFDISKNVTWNKDGLKQILYLAICISEKRKNSFKYNKNNFNKFIEITNKVEKELKKYISSN